MWIPEVNCGHCSSGVVYLLKNICLLLYYFVCAFWHVWNDGRDLLVYYFVCTLGWLYVACVGWWQRLKEWFKPSFSGWSQRQPWSPVAAENGGQLLLASDPLYRLAHVFWGRDSHWGLTLIDEARLPAVRPEDLPASTSQQLGLQVLATMPSPFFSLCFCLLRQSLPL